MMSKIQCNAMFNDIAKIYEMFDIFSNALFHVRRQVGC